jgi:hypothetical protein
VPWWRRRPQRLALVVNLLVLALGIAIGIAATYRQDAASSAPIPGARTVATRPLLQATPEVPRACLDAAELADEVIARLNRNQRDKRLSPVLRDYTIASQACRRSASP